ncbi:hypothetical protein BDV59DRAFT_167682 [Aspergillus ambiguus]|uniref:uncharacterized protein n=1 Tax=Aspergillus ambiguus TaxID=176160 RepID=UPI003CCE0A0C
MHYNRLLVALSLVIPLVASYKTLCTVWAGNDENEIACYDQKRDSKSCAALASEFNGDSHQENECIFKITLDASYEELEEICTNNGGTVLSYDHPPPNQDEGSCEATSDPIHWVE